MNCLSNFEREPEEPGGIKVLEIPKEKTCSGWKKGFISLCEYTEGFYSTFTEDGTTLDCHHIENMHDLAITVPGCIKFWARHNGRYVTTCYCNTTNCNRKCVAKDCMTHDKVEHCRAECISDEETTTRTEKAQGSTKYDETTKRTTTRTAKAQGLTEYDEITHVIGNYWTPASEGTINRSTKYARKSSYVLDVCIVLILGNLRYLN